MKTLYHRIVEDLHEDPTISDKELFDFYGGDIEGAALRNNPDATEEELHRIITQEAEDLYRTISCARIATQEADHA